MTPRARQDIAATLARGGYRDAATAVLRERSVKAATAHIAATGYWAGPGYLHPEGRRVFLAIQFAHRAGSHG